MWEFTSPTSHAFCTISYGKVESLSMSQATGRISFSAKSWASSRMSFCSSVRLKSTTLLAAPWPRAVLGRPIDSSVNPLAKRLQQFRLFAMDAFGTVLIAACVVAIVVAVVSYWGSGRLYRRIGVGELSMERERPPRSVPGPGSEAEAREEIRQMLEAKSARREARGDPPLDVEAELATLTRGSPEHDPTLREEVRQLVIARNERRRRQGKEPLDVEAEIDRQLRSLGG